MPNAISYYSITTVFCFVIFTSAQNLCPSGCLACTKSQRICTACDTGYQLTTNGLCTASKVQNCALFSVNGSCVACKPTFKLHNNTCVKDYSGCLAYRDNKCINCSFGTQLNNGSCSGVLNCQKYDGSCLACRQGYIYNSNKCFYIKRDCAKVDVGSGTCSVCAAGHSLVGFGCEKNTKVPYCELWQGQKCLVCKAGWGLLQGKCLLIPQCQAGQFLDESYQCQQLPQGCMKAQQKGCLVCYPNFNLQNATCRQQLPPNCQELTPKGTCKLCNDRYYVYQYQCKKVASFCGRYDSYGRCITCSFNYFKLSAGSCIDPNCLNFTIEGCTLCRSNFKVENVTNRCILNDSLCLIGTELSCSQCVSGYYPSVDLCLPLPSNCLRADREGACLQCIPNYYLQLDRCYQTNKNIAYCRTYYQYSSLPKCIQCQVGYFVVLGNCVQLPPYCSIVLSNGDCVACVANAQRSNNRCLIQSVLNCAIVQNDKCLRCSAGYVLGINNLCYPSKECQRDESGVCNLCPEGSVPSRGTCLGVTLIDINCKTYNNTVCTQCYPGYYQSNNVCNTPNPDCQTFDTTTGGCTACFPGYLLTNQQCILPPKVQYCLNYTSKGTCAQCQSFYYLADNTCLKVSQLCKSYNSQGACTDCYPGFTLVPPSCLLLTTALITNPTTNKTETVNLCEKYNVNSGHCELCKQGYYLADKKCINYASLPSADQNCKVYKNMQQCLQCYDGFMLSSGKCNPFDPLCKTYTQAARCSSCFQGYILVASSCVQVSQQQYEPCAVKANNVCIQCQSGYNLQKGVCIIGNTIPNTLPYCQVAQNATHCQLCTNGFYPQNGICTQISAYCQKYNPSTGQCLTCKQLYVFSEGSCVFPAMGVDENCEKYESVYCKICRPGYYLKEYVCRKIDGKCADFNFEVNQCLRCSQGTPLFDVCV